jgi:hypothetical protein
VSIVGKLIFRGVLPGGPRRIYHFLRTLPLAAPNKLPLVVVDWIAGLAMHDYVRRHFRPASESHRAAIVRRFGALRRAIAAPLRERRVALTLRGATRAEIRQRVVVDWSPFNWVLQGAAE